MKKKSKEMKALIKHLKKLGKNRIMRVTHGADGILLPR